VTFTTDFGTTDWFAGTLEGVIATISPGTRVIPITHEIPPQDVRAGAFALAAAYRYFPLGTIHVAIVDPGVGSTRKAIAVQTRRFVFIGPDNGVLSWALRTEEVQEIREITNRRFFLSEVSRTFHGRDVFAPVAAHLLRGIQFREVGPEHENILKLRWPEPIPGQGMISGEIIYIDRYGNCVTNIPSGSLPSKVRAIQVGSRSVPIKNSYAAAESGAALCVPGSHGYLELAVNGGSAERRFRLKVGSSVTLS